MSPVSPSAASPRVRSESPVVEEVRATLPAKTAPAVWTTLERLALSRRAPQMMRRHLVRSLVRVSVLMAGDAAALLVLRTLLRGMRDGWWLGSATASLLTSLVPPGALPLIQLIPAVLLGLIVLDTYGASDRRRDSGRIMAGATLGLGLPFWGYLWAHFSPLALPGFVVLATIVSITLVSERHLIDNAVRRLWPIGPGASRALLIGSTDDTVRALEHPALADGREFWLGGAFDPVNPPLNKGRDGFRRLCHSIKQYRADTLVLTSRLDDEGFAVVMEAAGAAGCQLYALSRSFLLGGLEFQTVWRRAAPLVSLNRPSLRGRQLLLKRVLDLTISTIGLVLLSPIFLGIAAAVRISSSGPIFFRQTRVGLGGKRFKMSKFRSMVDDAEAQQGDLAPKSLYTDARLFKLKDDPRVTRLGNFLRRTSLDELPQLWNVFRGDMSLVGPRPPLPSEVDLYEDHHYTRFDVKPGITGPWQVSGRNSITDFEEVIQLETGYIRGWSIWKDLGILLKTVPVVLFMRGAH
jgi:exopolysaccharide biosynthesis polyprenyl glycosylphosphotransferase